VGTPAKPTGVPAQPAGVPNEPLLSAELDALDAEQMRRSRRVKWQIYGEHVLPAWVAEMDFPPCAEIQTAIRNALDEDAWGYHKLPIDPRLREAFAAHAAERHGWQLDPRSVFALTNVVQGLDIGVLLYSQPGQGVVIQTPIYNPFQRAVDGNRRRRIDNPLQKGAAGYEIDWDHLRSAIDADTRVFLLCNPHNPTGRVFRRSELETLAELVLEHDLMVVSDEIHADLTFRGQRHIPFASLGPEIARRTLTVTSATKAFNIAGLPMAVAVVGGDEMKKRMRELPPLLMGHGGILGTQAAITAWTEGADWLTKVLDYLEGNRDYLSAFLRERLPMIGYEPPQATYLAWLDCRPLDLPDEAWNFFLDEALVAFSPGLDFGPPGSGHVRLNFATSRPILEEMLARVEAAVARLPAAP
jgi:cystathionine beta-lyase